MLIFLILLVHIATISCSKQYLLNTKSVSAASVHEDIDSGRKYYLVKVGNSAGYEESSKDYFRGIFSPLDHDYMEDNSDSDVNPVHLYLNIFNTNKILYMGQISIVEPR